MTSFVLLQLLLGGDIELMLYTINPYTPEGYLNTMSKLVKEPFVVMVMIYGIINSLGGEPVEIEILIYNLKLDDITLNETELGKEHDNSEFLLQKLGYKVNRNDKRSDCGGVLIVVKECHNQDEVYNDNTGELQ